MNIRCRAWHTTRKVMFSPEEMAADQLTLMPDGSGFINVSGDSTNRSQLIPQMIPMLSAGRTDKNGKEIFEGDVVRALWHWTEPHVIRLPDDFYDFSEFAISSDVVEVLGNKYQNEDLVAKTRFGVEL